MLISGQDHAAVCVFCERKIRAEEDLVYADRMHISDDYSKVYCLPCGARLNAPEAA